MGVDARMFVRLPAGRHLNADNIRVLSYAIASTFGAENFIITKLWDDWSGEKHHALSIEEPATRDSFYVGDGEELDDKCAALVGKVCYFQDGPPIVAEDGEQFVNVHLSGRYCGEGYERGDWLAIAAVIAWLRLNLPDGEVWYGGDSSGIEAECMTTQRVAALTRHFYDHGHRPYYNAFNDVGLKSTVHVCPICETGETSECGFGGGRDGYKLRACDGCGSQFVQVGDRVERLKRGEEWGTVGQRMQAEAQADKAAKH